MRLALRVAKLTAHLDQVRALADTWATSPDQPGVGGSIAGCEIRQCGRALLSLLDGRSVP